ncbi:acetolactate synthase, partial [Acinetobacter baumannii]
GLLDSARQPLVIAGGSRWTAAAVAALQTFADRLDLPVATSFRRQALFDQLHRCYAGDVGLGINPALKARIDQADLVLLLGGRLSEVPS